MNYLALILVSSFALAEAWFPVGKVGANMNYSFKDLCEQSEGQTCYDHSKCDLNYCELIDNEVLDYNAKDQAESCIDEADCIAKFDALVCIKGEKIRTEIEVYCTYPVYKIEGKKLVDNAQKKAERLAAKEAERLAAQADEDDKRQGCSELKGMGALIDSIEENIPNTVTTVNALRQSINQKLQDSANVFKKVKRCLK